MQLQRRVSRADIVRLEEVMRGAVMAPHNCVLTHHFDDGVYGRELFIPAHSLLVGKIHKHSHFNYVPHGRCLVASEFGVREVVGPTEFYSEPGLKRVVLALEDTTWITYHANPSNTKDLAIIEDNVIAKDYMALELHKQEALQ